jgi:uncharacterized membrane protein YraQ (UPF0718 family)
MTIKDSLRQSFRLELPLVALAGLVVFLPWSRFLHYNLPSKVQDALTIFIGIIVEALPFVLLGVLVAALIRRYISAERLSKFVPKHPLLAFPVVALLGLLFPVCECGNLPVARQLIRQGMRPSQAITFLLSAPILNPAVIISTYAAFRFSPSILVARLALGFIVAVTVGLYFYWRGDADVVNKVVEGEACEHNHRGLGGIVDELFEMLSALSLGAGIAALVQVLIPRSILLTLGHSPVAAIAIMMLLALIVSLCSNVDAFFALSFASTFSASSLVAFMVFGPMIDFRSLALLTRSFRPKAIITMAVLVAELVFFLTLLLHHSGLL